MKAEPLRLPRAVGTRLCCALVVALAGCGKGPPGVGVSGGLTVHTDLTVPGNDPITNKSVRVLLGDGSDFDSPVDAAGDVVFSDAPLGPQNVTVVVVDDEGFVRATTVVGVTRSEVWIPHEDPSSYGTNLEPLGTFSGTVTGGVDGGDVAVYALPPFDGFTTVDADGGYQMAVTGTATGSTDFFVEAMDPDGIHVARVGLKKDVTIDGASHSGVDLVADHAVDQTFTLAATHLPAGASFVNAELLFLDHGFGLFETDAAGTPPFSLASIALTPPFDETPVLAGAWTGIETALPNGKLVSFELLSDGGTSGSVAFPAPLSLSSPAIGSGAQVPTVSASGLHLAWSADPAAQCVSVAMKSLGLRPGFSWTVYAPADAGSFAFFALPDDASPFPGPPPGSYEVSASSAFDSAFRDWAARFGPDAGGTAQGSAVTQSAAIKGELDLK